jgi:hypothetical protein
LININLIDQNIKGYCRGTYDNWEGVSVELKGSGIVVFISAEIIKSLAKIVDNEDSFIPQVHAKRKLRDLLDIDEKCSGLLTGSEKSFLIGNKGVLRKDDDLTTEQKRTINELYTKYHYMIVEKDSTSDDVPF